MRRLNRVSVRIPVCPAIWRLLLAYDTGTNLNGNRRCIEQGGNYGC